MRLTDIRVLYAPITPLYQNGLLIKGIRKLGIRADLMLQQSIFQDYTFKTKGTYFLDAPVISGRILDFLLHSIKAYDIIHLHSGYSLLPNFLQAPDLRFLKKMGKIVFMSRWGCRDGIPPMDDPYYGTCDICPLNGVSCRDEEIRARLEIEKKYVDVIINHDAEFRSYNATARFLPSAIDLGFWDPDTLTIPEKLKWPASKNGEIKIVHSFARREIRGDIKGTSFILEAVKRLKNEGYRIDFRDISGISFKDVRFHILQADVVVDQLCCGSFGSFAREALCLGKPVISHVTKDRRQIWCDLPIAQADTSSIYPVLKDLLDNPSKREFLGSQARQYALENFDYHLVTRRLARMYYYMLNGLMESTAEVRF